MRFVSQYIKFGVGIRPTKSTLTRDGEVIVREEGIIAKFNPSYNQRDYEVANQTFQFHGLYQNEDQATLVDPAYRLSVYDTEEQQILNGWEDEEREMVERKLLTAQSYGTAFVHVPEMELAAPWPRYDDFTGTAEELVLLVHNVIGIPFETVLEYEQSKWGQQREEMIDALKTAIEVRDAGKVVVA